jgi:hypothetical protein
MGIRASVACIMCSSLVQDPTLATSAIAAHRGESTNLTAAFKKHFAGLPREPGEVGHAPGGSCAVA